jgi:hypothetical protein
LGTVQRTLEFDIYESEGFNSTLHPLNWLPDDSPRPNIRSGFVEWTIQSNIDCSELTAVCNLRDICGDKGNQNDIVPRCSAIPWNNRSVDSSGHTRFSYQAIGFEILFPFAAGAGEVLTLNHGGSADRQASIEVRPTINPWQKRSGPEVDSGPA